MPAEVTLFEIRLEHQLLNDLPVRRKGQDIRAELPGDTLHIFLEVRSQEPMIEPYHKRFNSIFFNQIVERPGTVFSAAERHDTVVGILITMFCYQNIERPFIRRPIDFLLLELMLPANIADAFGIE